MDGFLPWNAVGATLRRAMRRIKSGKPVHAIFGHPSDIALPACAADTPPHSQEDTP
jgi:hypothetical protein